jgi:hypothetical protein
MAPKDSCPLIIQSGILQMELVSSQLILKYGDLELTKLGQLFKSRALAQTCY